MMNADDEEDAGNQTVFMDDDDDEVAKVAQDWDSDEDAPP